MTGYDYSQEPAKVEQVTAEVENNQKKLGELQVGSNINTNAYILIKDIYRVVTSDTLDLYVRLMSR